MKNRLESLLELYKKDPTDSFLNYGIALEYMSAGDYEKAEHFLKKLLEGDPAYVPAYMQYAQLREKQNRIEEAKQIYNKGIKAAQNSNDQKSANEMQEFLDELE